MSHVENGICDRSMSFFLTLKVNFQKIAKKKNMEKF